jgi:hypothetical protein
MVSNRSLALLLVATIVISLGGTLISLNKLNQFEITGLVAGIVNLSIGTTAACNVDTNVSFGSGTPTTAIVLSTNADYGGVAAGFQDCSNVASPCYKGMQINNTGNVNLLVNFTSDKNASTLQGDSSPLTYFQYYIVNGTLKGGGTGSAGCTNVTNNLGANGTVVTTTSMTICNNLSYINGYDIVSIGYNLTINETTPKTGQKSAAITINCGQY